MVSYPDYPYYVKCMEYKQYAKFMLYTDSRARTHEEFQKLIRGRFISPIEVISNGNKILVTYERTKNIEVLIEYLKFFMKHQMYKYISIKDIIKHVNPQLKKIIEIIDNSDNVEGWKLIDKIREDHPVYFT